MARERLVERDQRYTDGRRRLVDALVGAGGPITLPALLTTDPSLSQSSAYRNLALMEEAGVVRRLVHGTEHAHYELAEDLTEHHHHLICSECGDVADYVVAPSVERRIEQAVEAIADETGFRIEGHRFDLIGHCQVCVGEGD